MVAAKMREELGEENELKTILVWNEVLGVMTCYGRQIDGGTVFRQLNMNTAEALRPRHKRSFRGCRQGYFVSQKYFEPAQTGKDWVMALVNIPAIPEEARAVPFRL
ncbi:MAG: hypothetical protein WCV68_04515 [Candidatus Paceibacterota bacterium]|jgi:hypothetical protein